MRVLLFLIFCYFSFIGLFGLKIDDSFNRRVYSFNRGFDKSFLNPSLTVYIKICPSFLDGNFDKFFKNISELNNFYFHFISFNSSGINNSLYRFFLNFYFGFFGFFDIAVFYDKYYSNFDFQAYMISLGSRDFSYIVIPFIGPSTLYFGLGFIYFHFFNPFFYFFDYFFSYYLFEILNKKSVVLLDINFFHNVMLDGYVFVKDIYTQNLESIFNFNLDNFLIEPPD